jgi:beta-galactosidase
MRAINHYLFFDGENDPLLSPVKRHDWGHPVRKDGSLRKHYARYPRLSRVFASYGSDLISSKPQPVTTIGFLIDQYMTEVNNSFSKETTNIITHQREVILFDSIARGLALTHRPFNALEITRATLDVAKTPLIWLMIEKQCDATIQQKLVDYVRQGGKLILVGRMCIEEFNHNPCTILKDALGIGQIKGGKPFKSETIQVFNYGDVPVSFLETYDGRFDSVFAFNADGAVSGFVKHLEKGKVLMLGAAFTANTLEDIDLVNQMALEMNCMPLCEVSTWVDVRNSCGPGGSFLFINNYQDDPVDTTIKIGGTILFAGHAVSLQARTGQILPLGWQLNENVMIHYATSEFQEVNPGGSEIVIKAAQNDFHAELSLHGYSCDPEIIVSIDAEQRIKVHVREGVIRLTRHK